MKRRNMMPTAQHWQLDTGMVYGAFDASIAGMPLPLIPLPWLAISAISNQYSAIPGSLQLSEVTSGILQKVIIRFTSDQLMILQPFSYLLSTDILWYLSEHNFQNLRFVSQWSTKLWTDFNFSQCLAVFTSFSHYQFFPVGLSLEHYIQNLRSIIQSSTKQWTNIVWSSHFRLLSAISGHFRQFLAIFGHFWAILVPLILLWSLLEKKLKN